MHIKKRLQILNLILGVLTALGGLCYSTIGHNLIIKTLASSMFMLMGLINLRFGFQGNWPNRMFSVIMTGGILFAMIADIVLEISFIGGAAVFAVGHICYLVAYCILLPLKWQDLIPGALVFAVVGAGILLWPIFDFGGAAMQVIVLAYAAIICAMFSKSLSNYNRNPGSLTRILALGSFMFLFSDFMLLFSSFAAVPRIFGLLCVNVYYPAQAVLSYSLFCTEE